MKNTFCDDLVDLIGLKKESMNLNLCQWKFCKTESQRENAMGAGTDNCSPTKGEGEKGQDKCLRR
jgi:hypothetical protein